MALPPNLRKLFFNNVKLHTHYFLFLVKLRKRGIHKVILFCNFRSKSDSGINHHFNRAFEGELITCVKQTVFRHSGDTRQIYPVGQRSTSVVNDLGKSSKTPDYTLIFNDILIDSNTRMKMI
jgi:hypothetical protein